LLFFFVFRFSFFFFFFFFFLSLSLSAEIDFTVVEDPGLQQINSSYCRHPFVTCFSQTQQIIAIRIENTRLLGTLSIDPLTAQTLAPALADFKISNCLLTGSIPNEIGMLTALTALDLSFNRLTGSIPATVDRLLSHRLQSLRLDRNRLADDVSEGRFGDGQLQVCSLFVSSVDERNCLESCTSKCCSDTSMLYCLNEPAVLARAACPFDATATVGAGVSCVSEPAPAASPQSIAFTGTGIVSFATLKSVPAQPLARGHSHVLWFRTNTATPSGVLVWSKHSYIRFVNGALTFTNMGGSFMHRGAFVPNRWYSVVAQTNTLGTRIFVDCDARASRCPQSAVGAPAVAPCSSCSCEVSVGGFCTSDPTQQARFTGHVDNYRFFGGVVEPLQIGAITAAQNNAVVIDTGRGRVRGVWLPVRDDGDFFGESAVYSTTNQSTFSWTATIVKGGWHQLETWLVKNATFSRAARYTVLFGGTLMTFQVDQSSSSGRWVAVAPQGLLIAAGTVVQVVLHNDGNQVVGADAVRFTFVQAQPPSDVVLPTGVPSTETPLPPVSGVGVETTSTTSTSDPSAPSSPLMASSSFSTPELAAAIVVPILVVVCLLGLVVVARMLRQRRQASREPHVPEPSESFVGVARRRPTVMTTGTMGVPQVPPPNASSSTPEADTRTVTAVRRVTQFNAGTTGAISVPCTVYETPEFKTTQVPGQGYENPDTPL
jgi:hypothetical protein